MRDESRPAQERFALGVVPDGIGTRPMIELLPYGLLVLAFVIFCLLGFAARNPVRTVRPKRRR